MAFGLDYRWAAVLSWTWSGAVGFWLNRQWTFGSGGGRLIGQTVRFLIVSGLVFGLTYAILVGLAEGLASPKLLAQAFAIATGTPMNGPAITLTPNLQPHAGAGG